MARGTSNRNARGNTRDREARKRWLLKVFEADVPGHCRCYRCGWLLCGKAGCFQCMRARAISKPSRRVTLERRCFWTIWLATGTAVAAMAQDSNSATANSAIV